MTRPPPHLEHPRAKRQGSPRRRPAAPQHPRPDEHGRQGRIQARKLNLRAPEGTPDGNHPVLTHGLSEQVYYSHPLTAEVRNGSFIPEVTADAVLVAASAAEEVPP